MAADLVEEDGEFKVLNLLYALDIDHPCAEPWTEAQQVRSRSGVRSL